MEINERRPGDEKEDEGIEEDKFKLYGGIEAASILRTITSKSTKRLCTTLQTNCGTIQSSKVHDLLRRQIIKQQFQWSRKIH